MSICCCFGSRNTNIDEEKLENEFIEIIEKRHIFEFHVVCEGPFGYKCASILNGLKRVHSDIKCYCVLAYLNAYDPSKENKNFDGSIFLNLENTPIKFRMVKRNQLMVEYADYIVFNNNYIGNVKNLIDLAEQKHKEYINLRK